MKFNRSDIGDNDRKFRMVFGLSVGLWLLGVLIAGAFWFTVIYVAWHFISKGW